jgi:ADP-ribosyl-[dinitrogen reductase] hydrolase
MYFLDSLDAAAYYSAESSKTTHGAQEAVDGCRLFGTMIAKAIKGHTKESILFDISSLPFETDSLAPKIGDMARGSYRAKEEVEIKGSGYVVASLEAALWCFYNTKDFQQSVLKAANLGDDADTTAAVCGQIAGAYYGLRGIPSEWLARLAQRDYIENLAGRLYEERSTHTTLV